MASSSAVTDDDGVVRIGSMVFALIRPTPGREVAFNHWYERDHYYTAGLAAPGVFSAARFIEPRQGLHLALYFVLPGHDDARVAFATEQVRLASAEGRVFADREHLHTWSYGVEEARVAAGGVPAALALDHRFAAVSVAMIDRDGADVAADLAAVTGDAATGDAPVSLLLRPNHRIMDSTWDGDVDPAVRRLVVAFHGAVPDVDPHAERSGLVWSAVFHPVVFGTDALVAD